MIDLRIDNPFSLCKHATLMYMVKDNSVNDSKNLMLFDWQQFVLCCALRQCIDLSVNLLGCDLFALHLLPGCHLSKWKDRINV